MTTPIETTFTFRNMDSTEALREHAMDKIQKLDKYLTRQTASAHVIFKVEGARHITEITVTMRGGQFVGTETGTDMYASLDAAVHKLEIQLSRNKDRLKEHKPH
jgi:putative sigma-54 modulation protein